MMPSNQTQVKPCETGPRFHVRWLAAVIVGLAGWSCVQSVRAADHKYLKAFPAAEDGMTRYVIELPHKERGEEDAFKVELIVGETMLTDGVNKYFLGGELKSKPLKGWGFTYYEVSKLGPAASTKIGVPPNQPPVEKFVKGPSEIIRYNSRVPIVVYVPDGAEVRYRIWKAGKTDKAVAK